MAAGVAFVHPLNKPMSSLTRAMPLASYLFTLASDSSMQALVYRDAFLKVPYNGNPRADEAGNFQPIYLDPRTQYQVQLVDLNGAAQYPPVTYLPPCPTLGPGPVQVNPNTGEVTLGPPSPGAGDAALELVSNGTFALVCPGNPSQPGAPLLQFLNCLTVGTTPVNYSNVANRPGNPFTLVSSWLPILGDGGITYYIPMWA